jgi:hypothetical protein
MAECLHSSHRARVALQLYAVHVVGISCLPANASSKVSQRYKFVSDKVSLLSMIATPKRWWVKGAACCCRLRRCHSSALDNGAPGGRNSWPAAHIRALWCHRGTGIGVLDRTGFNF